MARKEHCIIKGDSTAETAKEATKQLTTILNTIPEAGEAYAAALARVLKWLEARGAHDLGEDAYIAIGYAFELGYEKGIENLMLAILNGEITGLAGGTIIEEIPKKGKR